ncbi:hypothetical protein C0063_17675 [Pseudoxanthomonas sp. KAs_5_3]|nr:hypothetical protein C0063_17675 [Pseudoxanthomonas sp. KAs_5_3]SFV32148.1 hypothetical protein SAMN05428990_2326 [Pseudoxanthomonas sp. YR558]
MKSTPEATPRLDWIARIICIVLGSGLAAGAWVACATDVPLFARLLFGVGAAALFVAGTVAPQRVRMGLVAWLPWV